VLGREAAVGGELVDRAERNFEGPSCRREPLPRTRVTAAQALLGDDPVAIMGGLKAAIREGAAATDLGRSLAYAAALRLARFGSANEHADWETAHHVFTYANAVHQVLKQTETADREGHSDAVRGVLHGAMALYLARYLNVPPARIPGDGGEPLDDLPASAEDICVLCSKPSIGNDRSISPRVSSRVI